MIDIIDDYELIVPLWQEAFGDNREDIMFFTDNCKNKKCIAYYDDNRVCSMLFLVSCSCDATEAQYIYAACTADACRGRGYMSRLIDYCICEYGNICLIPASDTLVEYYSARGLDKKHKIENIKFSETQDIIEYLIDGYELSEPSALADF